MKESGLAWVIGENGEARHVSTFAHLPPRRRPAVRCPQCGRPLTLKLGAVLRHHAAHDPGHVCSATRPETALHLNCKFGLAAALRAPSGADALLTIQRQCAGAGLATCELTMKGEWLRGWDEVLVEHRVGESRRPDLILRRAATTIGAVEVFASNAVSEEKANVLAALGVPWIEVQADERFAAADGWTPTEALPAARTSLEREWRCDTHRARHTALSNVAEDRKSAELEARRHSTVLRAARVVDIYHDGGAHERLIYTVKDMLTDGRAHTVCLRRGGAEVATAPLTTADEWDSVAWPALRTAFAADLQRFARGTASFTDSPMHWARGDAAENIVEEALTDRVGRDPTPLATRFPRRWFFAKEQRRWFVPAELRDTRWDRDELDAFAAHPAWARTRAPGAVREHPAPEGSWDTPVFASRPNAAMFHERMRSVTRHGDSTIVVMELRRAESATRRAVVVIEREPAADAIGVLAASLRTDSIDQIWISHPLDWSSALATFAWAPAGRNARGQGGVVVDGVGIFRADQFARALAKDDRRLSADAIKRQMAARVQRMLGNL